MLTMQAQIDNLHYEKLFPKKQYEAPPNAGQSSQAGFWQVPTEIASPPDSWQNVGNITPPPGIQTKRQYDPKPILDFKA